MARTNVCVEIRKEGPQFGTNEQDGLDVYLDIEATRAVRALGSVGSTIIVECDLCPNPKIEARDKTPHAVLGRNSVHGLAKDEDKKGTTSAPAATTTTTEGAPGTTAMAAALTGAGITTLPETPITTDNQPLEKFLDEAAVRQLVNERLSMLFGPLLGALALSPDEVKTLQQMVGARFPLAAFNEDDRNSAAANLDRVMRVTQARRIEAAGLVFDEVARLLEMSMPHQLGVLAGELPTLDEKGNPVFACELAELLAPKVVEEEGVHSITEATHAAGEAAHEAAAAER